MKKALAILTALAVVGGAAFAEISVGGWGRGIFVPAMNDGLDETEGGDGTDGMITDTAPSWGSWGGDEARVGFTVSGGSDNVGFQIDMNADGSSVNLGDQHKIWVKPMDMVKLQMGRIYDDTLRGNGAFGSFNWYRDYGAGDGEDITFTRIGYEGSKEGFEVAVTPMEGVFAAVYFHDLDKNATAALASNMQLAGGYTIAGIGQIKAQYYTNATTYDVVDKTAEDQQSSVEVAFNLSAVENLSAEVGFKMNMNDDIVTKVKYAGAELDTEAYKKIALYANYKMDALTLHLLSLNEMAKSTLLDEAFTLYKVGIGADYALDGGFTVNADVRYTNTTLDNSEATTNFMVAIQKGLSNGLVGVGVQTKTFDGTTGFAIPVRMEYWF